MLTAADFIGSFLSSATWAETVSYVPAGGAEQARVSGIAAVIRREQATHNRDQQGEYSEYRYVIQVLTTVHATYKGIVAPAVGDTWKLPLGKGGSELDGWRAGPARAAGGRWQIPVTKRIYVATGGAHLEGR